MAGQNSASAWYPLPTENDIAERGCIGTVLSTSEVCREAWSAIQEKYMIRATRRPHAPVTRLLSP